MTTASTITVERSFYDSNDRITPGNFKHWEYKCNEQGNKCSCYYQGTFYSEEGERASCHKKDKSMNFFLLFASVEVSQEKSDLFFEFCMSISDFLITGY